jgi:hypothetical protein
MVNVNNVLSTRYWLSYDATALSYFWAQRVGEFCRNCGYSYLDLAQENATRENFEGSLVSHDPIFFHGWGHGNETDFTGYNITKILENCVNDQLLAGRITYLMACKTGAQLGPSIISKGGLGYIGYSDSYWMMDLYYALNSPSSAPFARYHWSNLDHTNFIANGILVGRRLSEAHTRSLERLQAWIDFWSQSSDRYSSDVISVLAIDRDCQVQLGDGNAALTPPVYGKHVRDCYAVGFDGIIVLPGSQVNLKVGCSCHVDDCNFVGKRWTLKRSDTGEVVASGTFTAFDRGLNFADLTFTAPDVAGEYNYDLIVEADSLHDETTGKIKVFTEYVNLWIFVLDEIFGNAIYKAKVTVDGQSFETDHQGSVDVTLTRAQATVTVEASGFESQTRTITITSPEQALVIEKFFLRPVGEGVFFEGYVKDSTGRPVQDALVVLGTRGMAVKTDSSGYYKIPQNFTLPRGTAYPLIVVHPDYKPQSILVNAPSRDKAYVIDFTLEAIEPNTIYIVGNVRDKISFIEVPNPNSCGVKPALPLPYWKVKASIESNSRGVFIVKIVVSGWREGLEPFVANVNIHKNRPLPELPPPPYDQYAYPGTPNYLPTGTFVNVRKRASIWCGPMEFGFNSFLPCHWVLKGFITDQACKPLSGIPIQIHGIPVWSEYDPLVPERWYTVYTDESGFFEVAVLKCDTRPVCYEFEINFGGKIFEYAKLMVPVTTDLSRKLPIGTVWMPAKSETVTVQITS